MNSDAPHPYFIVQAAKEHTRGFIIEYLKYMILSRQDELECREQALQLLEKITTPAKEYIVGLDEETQLVIQLGFVGPDYVLEIDPKFGEKTLRYIDFITNVVIFDLGQFWGENREITELLSEELNLNVSINKFNRTVCIGECNKCIGAIIRYEKNLKK